MHRLTGRRGRWLAARVLVALVLAGGLGETAAWPAAAASPESGCSPYVEGTVIPVPCSAGSVLPGRAGAGPGAAGTDGVTSRNICLTAVLSPAQAQSMGLGTPPPGHAWALLDCLGGTVGGPLAILVTAAAGIPQVTPRQLMMQALGELRLPPPRPATAPPMGSEGLVGLPEWFWVPAASWRPRSVTVTAGPVWATVTATPAGLTVDPGAGLAPVACAGPGTAYDPGKPAAGQHSDCTYRYTQPSLGLPGDAYQVSVAVTWQVAWTGSGGAGSVLAPALSVPAAFTLRVAQGEALVTSS